MYCFSGRETFVEYWQLLIWWFEGSALSIKWSRIFLRFSNERRGAYFCPTSIEGGALSSIQFVLYLTSLLHLWSICIPFEGIITLVVSYHICGLNIVLNSCHLPDRCSTPCLCHIGCRIWASKCILVYSTPRQLPAAQFVFFFFFSYGTHRPSSLFFLSFI